MASGPSFKAADKEYCNDFDNQEQVQNWREMHFDGQLLV